MRKLIAVVFCFWMMVCPVASQDRWELMGTSIKGVCYYLDVTTIVRPNDNEVIYWDKTVKGNEVIMNRIKMWRSERKFQVIDTTAGGRGTSFIDDIPPESVVEAFYNRFFK